MASDQTSAQSKATNVTKANIDRTADQGARLAEASQEGLHKMADLREKAVESTREIVQSGFEIASRQAREVSERFTRNFGLGGEDSQRLAEQSKQNMDAVARCGTILTQGFQDASRGWFEFGQKQFQRNVDAVQRLARVRTTHEFASVQSELLRENMQHFVQDSRAITERSLRVAEEAGKTFANVATQGGRN